MVARSLLRVLESPAILARSMPIRHGATASRTRGAAIRICQYLRRPSRSRRPSPQRRRERSRLPPQSRPHRPHFRRRHRPQHPQRHPGVAPTSQAAVTTSTGMRRRALSRGFLAGVDRKAVGPKLPLALATAMRERTLEQRVRRTANAPVSRVGATIFPVTAERTTAAFVSQAQNVQVEPVFAGDTVRAGRTVVRPASHSRSVPVGGTAALLAVGGVVAAAA